MYELKLVPFKPRLGKGWNGNADEFSQGGDDEVVVVALGQAGDDGCTDGAGAGEVDRKATAVGSVVGEGEAVAGFDGVAVPLKDAAHGVGAAGEAADGVALAADPVGLAGSGAGGGASEKKLAGEVDFDGAAGVGRKEPRAHQVAELPSGSAVKSGEAEEFLLLVDDS